MRERRGKDRASASGALAAIGQLGRGGVGVGVLVAIGVAATGLALALRDDESGLRAWWALRADLHAAELRIERLRGEVAALERHSGGLEADPFVLESAIRERLELAKPGETLVRLPRSESRTPWIP